MAGGEVNQYFQSFKQVMEKTFFFLQKIHTSNGWIFSMVNSMGEFFQERILASLDFIKQTRFVI